MVVFMLGGLWWTVESWKRASTNCQRIGLILFRIYYMSHMLWALSITNNNVIKGLRSYFKGVLMASSFCGEGSFRVMRDLNEWITLPLKMNESWPIDTSYSNSKLIIRYQEFDIEKSATRGVCAHKTSLK